MFSEYSFVMGFLWLNFYLLIVFLLRKKVGHLRHFAYLLIAAILVGVLRVVLPFDFPFAKIINSYDFLRNIRVVLNSEVLGTGFILKDLLLFSWFLGSLVTLIIVLADARRSYLRRKSIAVIFDTRAENAMKEVLRDHPKLKECRIVVTPDARTPQITGYFSPTIYIPTVELSDEELRHIITHELMHFYYRDTWTKLFYYSLCIVFWWNPLIHVVRHDLDLLLEVNCDLRVTKKMSDAERLSYLSTALDVLKKTSCTDDVRNRSPVNTIAFVGNRNNEGVIQRFHAVGSDREKGSWRIAPVFALLVFTLLLSFLVIVQPAGNPPSEDLEGVIQITPENSYIQGTNDGKYHLIVDGIVFAEVFEDDLDVEPHSKLDIIMEDKFDEENNH